MLNAAVEDDRRHFDNGQRCTTDHGTAADESGLVGALAVRMPARMRRSLGLLVSGAILVCSLIGCSDGADLKFLGAEIQRGMAMSHRTE